MDLYFRELTLEDIPAVKDISKDIWEGHDYVPGVIEEWLQDKDCMNYGAFKDREKKEMVGFGRVKLFNKEIAWLEGGRVKISYQRQGIGRDMMRYAINFAYEKNVKVAQYSTSSKNFGSLSLSKYFEFKRKKCMNVLDVDSYTIELRNYSSLKVKSLSTKEIIQLYKNFDIGPGNEVCVGWSYVPIKFLTNEYGTWIYNNDAIVNKIKFKRSQIKEGPKEDEIWLIPYGNPEAGFKLIQYILREELKDKEKKYFEIFCYPDIAKKVETIGFSYYEGEPFGVILFEKSLN